MGISVDQVHMGVSMDWVGCKVDWVVFWCFNGLQVWCISDGCEYVCGRLCGLVYFSGLCGLEYFSGLSCMTVLFPPTGYF